MPPITKEDLDWLRSPEAAEKGYDEEQIKCYEELWRKTQDLEARICSAYDGVVLGEGVGILEAEARDTYVDPEELKSAREKDERHSWHTFTEDDIYRFGCALSFTDAEGFRFLIPAFMLVDLRCPHDQTTLIHLSLVRDDSWDRYSKLNAAQLATIVDFLALFRDDPECKFHHDEIDQALTIFWKPRLIDQIQAEQGGATDGNKTPN